MQYNNLNRSITGIGATKVQVLTKGTDIFNSMLLEQYQKSPNLKQYMLAFIEEMDELFHAIDEVYYGRFINSAVGKQLDVIGIILQQSRAVELETIWFGFAGQPSIDGFADEAYPASGGLFRSGESEGFEVTPLDDTTYRKVLLAKALMTNRDSIDIDLVYYIIITLLDKVPSVLHLRDSSSLGGEGPVPTQNRVVELVLSRAETLTSDVQLINYMARYFIPNGVTFTIIQTGV